MKSLHRNFEHASRSTAQQVFRAVGVRMVAICLAVTALSLSPVVYGQSATQSTEVDPSGTWKWTSEMGDNIIESVLTLEKIGDEVTGTYRDQNVTVAIKDAEFKDGKLSWRIDPQVRGMKILAEFSGKVDLDSIDGDVGIEVDGGSFGDFDWDAKRFVRPEDVVGKWDFEFTADDGNTYKPLLVVKHVRDQLTATVGNDEGQVEIKTIALKDNTLSFGYTIDYNGSPLKLQYECKPRGNVLTGTMQYEVEDASGQNTVVARKRQLSKTLRKLVGNWKFVMSTPEGDQTADLTLSPDGDELEAKLDGQQGAVELVDFEVTDDGVIQFEFTVEHSGIEVHNTWESKLAGSDEMEGTITYDFEGQEGAIDFTGKRSSDD